jgi:hypothetical protein
MDYQLTEAQRYFDADYKYRITLKYPIHINRALDKANEDMKHLRNRVHRKLFGRRNWDLTWFPSIEQYSSKGVKVRTHIHLYVGAIPAGVKRVKTKTIGAWFPPALIRQEWEQMHQSVISKNEEIRSYIEIIDRDKSIGYGTKTFLDSRYNNLVNAMNTTTDVKEKQDIAKVVSRLREKDLFVCVADTFYIKEADKII